MTDVRAGGPDVAWAMQRTGDAAVVVQGALSPDDFVALDDVPLPGGSSARFRMSDPTGPTLKADVEVQSSANENDVITAAVRAAKQTAGSSKIRASQPEERPPSWHKDGIYWETPLPSRELRVLALFRFWNVIHWFYPYLPRMGDTWDRAFAKFLPRFEMAADVEAYDRAVVEMAALIPDGHVNVEGLRADLPGIGQARAPFTVRVIEGQTVITSLPSDPALAPKALSVGDVVVAVDHEPIDVVRARIAPLVAASNDAWRTLHAASLCFAGPRGSTFVATVRDAKGDRDVTVTRVQASWPERSGPVYRVLEEDGVGYVDLDRLEKGDVDATFAAFEKTKAIVFDMRGYPRSTAWSIAPRINIRSANFGSEMFEPLVALDQVKSSFFEQAIATTDKPLYRGKTVMLVDERTMSQAEHTGLLFEAAGGTRFVGSQTAGANGDVTNLTLPGGLAVQFSGHDVRHADGRPLQGVGLIPDIEVRPTLKGIRAGRDEVLERALAALRSGSI